VVHAEEAFFLNISIGCSLNHKSILSVVEKKWPTISREKNISILLAVVVYFPIAPAFFLMLLASL